MQKNIFPAVQYVPKAFFLSDKMKKLYSVRNCHKIIAKYGMKIAYGKSALIFMKKSYCFFFTSMVTLFFLEEIY